MTTRPLDPIALRELILEDYWPKLKEIPQSHLAVWSPICIEFAMMLSAQRKETFYKKPYRAALLHRAQRCHYLLGIFIDAYTKVVEALEPERPT